LARRGYDPLLGYSGAEGALYPALSNEATQQELSGNLSFAAAGDKVWPARKEAGEVAWLLGAPFILQVVEGPADNLLHVIGGTAEAGEEGIRLLNANWRVSVDALADVVVAGITGDATRHSIADLAAALATAARVVKPDGRILLLTQASPDLGEGMTLLRQAGDPQEALKLLRTIPPRDMAAAYLWANAAQRASLYLLSELPGETAEDLFATPLETVGQVQRLLDSPGSRLFLSDAHKTLAFGPNTSQF
jgi:nickel-dependent lactate racemase